VIHKTIKSLLIVLVLLVLAFGAFAFDPPQGAQTKTVKAAKAPAASVAAQPATVQAEPVFRRNVGTMPENKNKAERGAGVVFQNKVAFREIDYPFSC